MIGIKMAEAFAGHGMEVLMADKMEHIFPLQAHPRCAARIEEYLGSKGIGFRFGAGVVGIETSESKGPEVFFDDSNESARANIILIAIGTRPNLSFIDPTQVETEKGIIVNERMQTGNPNLYAAGDVAQGTNLLTGRKEIIGLLANARYQGRTAGRNMAGERETRPGYVPYNISHFFDMDFVSIGDARQDGDAVEEDEPLAGVYRRFVMTDNKIAGINLLNDVLYSGAILKNILKHDAEGIGTNPDAFCMPRF